MADLPDPTVLDRYLAGECTASERVELERGFPGRSADEMVAAVRAGLGARDGSQSEARIRERLAAMKREAGPRKEIVGRQTLRRVLWSTGSMVVAALIITLVSYRVPRASETTRTYATQSGQEATFTLPDGTRVTLAPRTILRLMRFGTSSRTVQLEGQAYFDVVHSSGTPFLVQSGAVTTQVLGTSFLIRHYANDERVHVAVTEGKVRILPGAAQRWPVSSPVTLASGYVSDATDSTVLVNKIDDWHGETDWLHGLLTFHHVPISDVLRSIGQWYGYQFRCSDSTMIRERVTLAVNTRSAADALAMLEQVLNVHMMVVGDTVTLMSETSRSGPGETRKQAYDVWIPTREVGR